MPQGPAKFQAQLDDLFSSQTNFQRLLLIAKALSSNDTVDEGFPPMEFSVDKYFYFYHELVSNYFQLLHTNFQGDLLDNSYLSPAWIS
jgi:hypothetical protein